MEHIMSSSRILWKGEPRTETFSYVLRHSASWNVSTMDSSTISTTSSPFYNNSAIRMGLAIWKLFKKHLHYACTRGLTEQPQKGLYYNRASTEHKESKITTSNSLRRPELICRNLLLILAKAWSKYTAFTGSWAKVKLLKKTKPDV